MPSSTVPCHSGVWKATNPFCSWDVWNPLFREFFFIATSRSNIHVILYIQKFQILNFYSFSQNIQWWLKCQILKYLPSSQKYIIKKISKWFKSWCSVSLIIQKLQEYYHPLPLPQKKKLKEVFPHPQPDWWTTTKILHKSNIVPHKSPISKIPQ